MNTAALTFKRDSEIVFSWTCGIHQVTQSYFIAAERDKAYDDHLLAFHS